MSKIFDFSIRTLAVASVVYSAFAVESMAVVNCVEAGVDLTARDCRKMPRRDSRCSRVAESWNCPGSLPCGVRFPNSPSRCDRDMSLARAAGVTRDQNGVLGELGRASSYTASTFTVPNSGPIHHYLAVSPKLMTTNEEINAGPARASGPAARQSRTQQSPRQNPETKAIVLTPRNLVASKCNEAVLVSLDGFPGGSYTGKTIFACAQDNSSLKSSDIQAEVNKLRRSHGQHQQGQVNELPEVRYFDDTP